MNIKITNLTKTYGTQKAVNNISFEVKTGEILGFLGPNGAGKTTTMKIITGFVAAGQGEIEIDGHLIKTHDTTLKRHIGYLPENNPLYHDMPVMDYLAFCAGLQGIPKSEIGRRVQNMVQVCGLDVEKHKLIGELSKGYRQRVGLAQAMIHDPDILILDEPTTGLDPNQIIEIRELIRELGKEKTVILSTHILPEVEATCNRILIINKGQIVADGTAEALRKQTQGQDVLTLQIEDGETEVIVSTLQALPTITTTSVLAPQRFEVQTEAGTPITRAIFQCCVENGWVLTEMTPMETKLEDIFRNLTLN